jgi:hypothetical protein
MTPFSRCIEKIPTDSQQIMRYDYYSLVEFLNRSDNEEDQIKTKEYSTSYQNEEGQTSKNALMGAKCSGLNESMLGCGTRFFS